MFESSIVGKTGQLWKLRVAFFGGVVGFFTMVIGLTLFDSNITAFYISIAGLIVGLSSFIFACTTIRCPNCGAYWLVSVLKLSKANDWLLDLSTMKVCPKCKKEFRDT